MRRAFRVTGRNDSSLVYAEVRGAEVGKERQARQEFKYACVGYALWEDGAVGSGAGAGAHMPAVLCTGLEVRGAPI